jgi:hypothetical protein
MSTEKFQPIFTQLKTIFQPYEGQLMLQADTPENYSLATPPIERLKKEMFFGAVQIRKNYVSFHLMPVYVFPALLDNLSPDLKKRMQGKSCFNFTRLEPSQVDELAQLIKQGFDAFKQEYNF